MNMTTLWIDHDRDLYLRGLIDLATFEQRVENTLAVTYEQVVWKAAQRRAARATS